MTPAEFTPYIQAKIKHREEEIRMENGRIGLVCAIIQNGVPVGYVKNGAKTHKPGDYFRDTSEQTHDEGSRTQRIFDTMNAWCTATAGGAHD